MTVQIYKRPLNAPLLKENCTTGFERTILPSSGALRLASAFMGVERFSPDEERLLLSKAVVQFSFTYDALRGLLYIF